MGSGEGLEFNGRSAASLETACRDELHRRIGRNLLKLQEIEQAWKRLLLTCVIEGAPADSPQGVARWAASVQRMNMGDVAKALFDEVLATEPRERPVKGDRSKLLMRIRITPKPSAGATYDYEGMRERWKGLVDERNHLVHHFAERWASESAQDPQPLLDELDDQFARAEFVLAETLPLLDAATARREVLASWWQSEDGRNDLTIALTRAIAVQRLCEIAAAKARRDGWTYESTACSELRRRDPTGSQRLRASLGQDWLQGLLRASPDVFEVREEPVPNGSPIARRLLYRLRG